MKKGLVFLGFLLLVIMLIGIIGVYATTPARPVSCEITGIIKNVSFEPIHNETSTNPERNMSINARYKLIVYINQFESSPEFENDNSFNYSNYPNLVNSNQIFYIKE